MEQKESFGEIRENPAQENLGHLQSIKREVESLEDFEDITKDVPSMKDITSQFLQYETDFRNEIDPHYDFQSENFRFGDKSQTSSEEDKNASPLNEFSDFQKNENNKENEHLDFLLRTSNSAHQQSLDISEQKNEGKSNNSINLDELDLHKNKIENDNDAEIQNKESLISIPQIQVLEENKLVDLFNNDNNSSESEDSLLIQKKQFNNDDNFSETEDLLPISRKSEYSFVLPPDLDKNLVDSKSENDKNDDTYNGQAALSKFTSKSKIHQTSKLEILQGDGLHVKENDDNTSENEEFIPEPVPRDYPEIGAIEGKEFLAAIGLDTWFHPNLLNPKIESLVYWRDPKKSGVVFGSILVVLLSLTTFSLISVVAYTSLILLSGALSFRIYKSVLQAVQKTTEGHPFKEYLEFDLTLNPDRAREISDTVVKYINKSLNELRRLFLVEDVIDSIKFAILLWCLTYVGSWFNGLSLLIIAFVGLFTLPKVYENNQIQIDSNIDLVKAKIKEVTEKIKAVSPIGNKTDEGKDKNE